jgi:hypothetical protein
MLTSNEILQHALVRLESQETAPTAHARLLIIQALEKSPVTPHEKVFDSIATHLVHNQPSANHSHGAIAASMASLHASTKVGASHSAGAQPFQGANPGYPHPLAMDSFGHSGSMSSIYPTTQHHSASAYSSDGGVNQFGKRIAELQDQSRYVKPAVPCNFWGPVVPGGPLVCGREQAMGFCPFQHFHLPGVTRPPQKWLSAAELAQQRANQAVPTQSESSQSGLGPSL